MKIFLTGDNMKTEILSYSIFNKSKSELVNFIKNSSSKMHIVSGNPEVLNNGLKDKELYNNFQSENTIIIPDGIGVVIPAAITRQAVYEKIAGIDLMEELLLHCNTEGKSIYLLGSKNDILVKCMENIHNNYHNLKIAGYHNGYFDLQNCEKIISDINKSNSYVIFVAMGSPRQEKFIVENYNKINCRVLMGVGGSFDVQAGNVKRAPKIMVKLGLEWLYRVYKEPFRFKRLLVIPGFMIKAIFNEVLNKKY